MKQTIAIIIDYISFNEDSINQGIGGSETWAIEISKLFSKNGYHVKLFTLNDCWHFSKSNVEYIQISNLDYILSYSHIDYFFISRYIHLNTFNILSKYLNKNLYWVAHDTGIVLDNNYITGELIENNDILKNNLQKIICMSDFGAKILNRLYKIPEKYFEIIGNGLSITKFNNLSGIERDNNLFWSSRYERGLQLLVEKILPILKEQIPDIKVYVAQYENQLPEDLLNNPDIIFLGKLGKDELYQEFSKHKVWFYPNFYPETFCITLLEAIMCNNEIVMPYNFGPITTCKYFKNLLLPFQTIDTEEKYHIVANEILNKMKNYSNINRIQIRNITKNIISDMYSWENIYKQFKEKILK